MAAGRVAVVVEKMPFAIEAAPEVRRIGGDACSTSGG
jgi:hypothetical protein